MSIPMLETTKAMSTQNVSQTMIENLSIVESKRSSIEIMWQTTLTPSIYLQGYQIQYQKLASTYVQYGPRLPASHQSYNVENLVPDTNYKICLSLISNSSMPSRECLTASTLSWDLPVSVGSSIGAILALAMIILLILLIRCRSMFTCKPTDDKNYDSVASHCNDEMFDIQRSEKRQKDGDKLFSSIEENPEVKRHRHTSSGSYSFKQSNPYSSHKHCDCHKQCSDMTRTDSHEKRKRDSASGAIPKTRISSSDSSHQSACHLHSRYDQRPVNGHVRQTDIPPAKRVKHQHQYHDQSIILHIDKPEHIPETEEHDHVTCPLALDISEKRQILKNRIATFSFSSSIDSGSLPPDKLDIIMAFPNADSDSDLSEEECKQFHSGSKQDEHMYTTTKV